MKRPVARGGKRERERESERGRGEEERKLPGIYRIISR